MSKRPTMQDVADMAGVSLSTVDRILNRRTTVKPSTLRHVLETAQRIGFYGTPVIRDRLSEQAPACTFGFLLNPAPRTLYREFADRLSERVRNAARVRGTPMVVHLDRLDERMMIDRLYQLAAQCDVIAAVVFDTPAVHDALKDISAKGCGVVAMLTDVCAPECLAFIGADPIKMGRGTGWIISALLPAGGRVLLLSGSRSYNAHQAYVSGFQSYVATTSCSLDVGPVVYTQEEDARAEDIVRSVLDQDLIAGIVVAGGGLEGVVRATQKVPMPPKIIGTEASPYIDIALAAGTVDAVISHPLTAVVEQTVTAMEDFILSGRRIGRKDHIVPVEIRISETV
ncbi:hypothetical protein BFP70_04225 [Thioclava sp. SK-1]|uniref:LacI family DNA-binding transcriptional regulator n=1 Tax=Thioclava sp. SK-1 TaxID=1889770 RepID=UPI0008266DA5|nr:LacI family DNA-binding transcriptional regulator [Thioclava sp. SK-1]OCX66447.1 hypothetical protein BFP70_04225 [Thioclava sp. SK-1]